MTRASRSIRTASLSLPRRMAIRVREGTPTLPSWIVSFVLHGALLAAFATTLKSCGPGGLGGPGEADYREVGIYLKAAGQPEPQEAMEDAAGEGRFQTHASTEVAPDPLPDHMEADLARLLELPKVEGPSIIGAGAPMVSSLPARADDLLQSPGVTASVPNPAAGQGETSFFNIRAKGTRFVYVLDRSGSMDSYKAIRVAKAELIASLQSLDATQQFQIVFYNQAVREMSTPDGKRRLFWATDINRTLARQFIASIHADGGTDHLPALKRALSYSPEHIFFLTDADQPQLTAADLDEIRRLNRGRTKIHCIEFGKGPDVPVDNFLKRLARQNGGTYRYRDVTQFGTSR